MSNKENKLIFKKPKQRVKIWTPDTINDGRSLGSLFASDENEDPDHEYGMWHCLPDLLIEKIFQYLTIRERYYASQVCRSWNEGFYFPRVWHTFLMYDGLLTKRKFNYYAGWEKLLDHFRVSIFLTKKGAFIRTLIFQPMTNLFNLYEFLNIAFFMYSKLPGTLEHVHTMRFHFSCHLSERAEELVFGTGGQILIMLKRVMGILPSLKTLELTDLLLDGKEGLQLLDDVCISCCESLSTLILINVTKMAQTLLHPGIFVNLQTLVISPQNIGEDLLELLGNTTLRNMHLVQNKYTENCRALDCKAWKACRESNPKLRVHLRVEGNSKKGIVWQPRAPVKTIVYDSPYAKISTPMLMNVIELYKRDLEIFAYTQLPRFYMPRSFHDRVDSSLLLLVRQCPYIHTLMIREKISTSTVLLLAYSAKNLQYLFVRRNALLLKADWPRNPDWTPEFYSWLRKNGRSYEAMEKEVSQILGYRWQALTDKQFKIVHLELNKPLYMYS